MSTDREGNTASNPSAAAPELQLIYDTAPVGLAFLTPDCRYLQVNQRLTEICGISVADHIGRSVRETVPQVADQVEAIVHALTQTGQPITDVEVRGQRSDGSNAEHTWRTSWYPLYGKDGTLIGISVVAEDTTERKRAEAALSAREQALQESEARFQELADNMSQFAWTADETGWRNWYNRRWYDYSGTTFEEMEGWGWQKLHHPDHFDRVVRRMQESFESGMPWDDTFPLRGRDGTYRWFLTRALPIRDDRGRVVRWFGTNTDVTEQIAAENALRELNATLEQRVQAETQERLQVWNVSQDLLVVADSEGKYVSLNPAWTATLGWSETDLLGNTWQWLLHPDDRERTGAVIDFLARGGTTVRFESRFRHRDGSHRWVAWRAAADRGRIYAVGRDITELKSVERALSDARQELARVSRQTMLAATTASIAHEINQPLAAITVNGNAALRWLAHSPPDLDEVRASLKRIVNDGNRAAQVIAGIRSMFRKEASERHRIDINHVLREVLALLQGEFENHGVSVNSELDDGIPLIAAERVQLQQVVLNLILNAVEAMSQVIDRQRWLLVQSSLLGEHNVLISVADSGPGIDAEHATHIFQAFYSTKPQGTGMGLSICSSIVAAHGGRLWFEPRDPFGSKFHVQLPIADLT